MKKSVVIVGGSAGASIASEIFISQYDKVFFLETYSKKIEKQHIIADSIDKGIDFLKRSDVDYFIATGDNQQRKSNYDRIYTKVNKNPVNCIHSAAYISPSSKIGFGNLICPFSVIHTNAVIGNNTIINTGTIIEHDCKVGDYAQVSPNATLCGNVEVGELSFVGAGSVVIPKKKIGVNTIVAAGASVITNLEDNKMYAGVPAVWKKDVV